MSTADLKTLAPPLDGNVKELADASCSLSEHADEIRQLADSSRETASNIQNINNMVTAAVKELANNSNEIIQYVKESVMPAYDDFVAGGTQYKEDADHVNEIVTQFNEMSVNIDKLVSEITDAMNGIASAVDESAMLLQPLQLTQMIL